MATPPHIDTAWSILSLPHVNWLPGNAILASIALVSVCVTLAALLALLSMRRRHAKQLATVESEHIEVLEMQKTLLKRDACLRTILKHTNTIIFILDYDGTVRLSEGMAQNAVKDSQEGSVGKKFHDAYPELSDLQAYLQQSMQGETVQDFVSYSGGTFRLLTSPLTDAEGKADGLAGILLDVTEIEQARARITESENMFRSIFDNAPYSMVVQRISDGVPLEANQAFLKRMNITRVDLRQFDANALTELSDEEAHALRQHIAKQGGLHGQEATTRRPDGSIAHVIYTSVPITYDGEPCLLSLTVDITPQKEALHAKMESEETLRTLFNNAPLGIFRSTFNGPTEEVNRELVRMLGYENREELLAARPHALYAEPQEKSEFLEQLLASPAGVRSEVILHRKDGNQLPVAISASLQLDAEGRPSWINGFIEDLSKRKEHERELQFWTRRFEIVNTAAQHIFYDYDLRSGNMQWVGAVREVLGFELQELDGPVQRWKDLLPPEDAPEVLLWLEEVCAHEGKFDIEYRLRHKHGHYVYVHDSGVIQAGNGGQPRRMLGIIQDISARKQAELALAASEKMYRTLFESAQDTILVMDGPTIVDCNPSATALIGCTREEMIGRAPADFSPRVQADGEETTRMMRRILEHAEAGERLRFEWLCQRVDGGIIEVETSLTPMDVGGARYLLALTRDVSKSKEAERNLRLSEEKFSKIYNLAPYSISISRLSDSIILDVNAAFEKITGHVRSESIGKSGDDLQIWNDHASRTAFLEQLHRDGTVFDYEFIMRRKDGTLRNALNSCQYLEINGERCSLNIVRDITEIKLAQQAMVQTEKMMSLGGLAAGMAHEINNPLGIIAQSVQGVQRRLDPALPTNLEVAQTLDLDMEATHEYMRRRNILRYLEGIREANERATSIVRNMLNFSRKSDSGFVDRNVSELVRQAVSLAEKDYDLKKNYDFRQIAVHLMLSESLPSIPCIPSEVEQVLLNLLRNAAQALAEAGTVNPTITVRAAREDGEAIIQVEDNGPGISANQVDRVFEPFYTTKKVGEGTGLGLSVSYFIITTTHRGKMSVDSKPGRGTCFTIRLPLTRTVKSSSH
ncbi:PAS domain-containing protein [Fundidesulfovibrio putealis]|uniref:PAS domain-containing protein n=1 Tax=Fundidesulfovibrio putealis TaxID=270496 RepID=UPI00040FC077|nr:PAS domain S-box protein [Fundidesulfovibrio putealis]